MMKDKLYSCILLIAIPALLASCSARCNCPQCPDRTTVVTPEPGATVLSPE